MRKWGLVFLLLIYFPFIYLARGQNISNEGTDFWAVFPTHDPSSTDRTGPRLANVRIYVTSKTNSEVTVSCGTYNELKQVPANTPVPFNIPRQNAYILEGESNSILPQRAVHVVVTPGHDKVAVYEHIYAGARSAASLILPIESLGQSYYSMNYVQDNDMQGTNQNFLTLVATEPNTTLLIHENNGNNPPLQVHFTNAGEVYQYMPANHEDLTGVFVNVDPASPDNCNKRFAAFSGSTSLSIGCRGSRDPLFQQLYPTISWGKTYGVVPFMNRGYMIRILALDNNTKVQFNGNTITLDQGKYYENPGVLTEPLFISADKKISVAQYSLTQNCSSAGGGSLTGDPDMVLLNPIEFNIKSITLFSSNDEDISEKYINVFIKKSAAPTFKIDGAPPSNGSWAELPSNPEYSYIQISINNLSSTLSANEGFNAIAYGFGSTESYAYSAGTSLTANNYLLISNRTTHNDALNACVNQPSDFKISLPYKAAKIRWKLDDEAAEEYTPVPVEVPSANGPSYVYIYPKNITFPDLAKHTMTVEADMPNLDNCLGSSVSYNFTFEVYPIPTADVSFDAVACPDTEIPFTDKSLSNITDKQINKWAWDFGDGTPPSTEQNPKHVYNSPGNFTIRFTAGLDDGCVDEITRTITIGPKITPEFYVDPVGCIRTEMAFHDQSAVASGTINYWLWDFGDGTATSTEQHPKHIYNRAGAFDVKLITGTENGCKSLPVIKRVTIKDLPEPDFSMPEICIEDHIAEFRNISADGAGGISGLSYHWDFGDDGSLHNTSDDINGSHEYTAPGNYTVTLTVTSSNGCVASKQQEFTVNGSVITASFEVLNEDNLCSSKKVVVKNTSSVNSGKITKLMWYMDAVNKPGEFITDEEPGLNKTYEFTYPAFTSAGTKNIEIKLVAYSGMNCAEETVHTITLHPSPLVTFDAIAPVCVNDGIIQIGQARETLNIQAGVGKYTGPGIVSADGRFDPRTAGVGTHTITYTFTAAGAGACDDSKSQTITVYPVPTITIEKDISILAGGEKKVNVSATGNGLTYKWSPSINLDKDDVLSPTIRADEDRAYTLTVTSSSGCSVSERIFVHVLPGLEVFNAFSPNGDGENDTWNLKYIDTYPKAIIEVFNRYGERVFFSRGYTVPFDGNYKGQPLPVGTYYYIIDSGNGRKKLTGSLTLLR